MKHLNTLLAGVLLTTTVVAQDVIVRQRNGTSSYYYPAVNDHTTLTQILVDEAVDGDTIQLPGAQYFMDEDVLITKRLIIIGTGSHPDSASISGSTRISTTVPGPRYLSFLPGSDGTELHGLTFDMTAAVRIGVCCGDLAETDVDGLKFTRCRFNRPGTEVITLGDLNEPTLATNILISECAISGYVNLTECSSVTITNSILDRLVRAAQGAVIENCILLDFDQTALNNYNTNALFKNNIFTRQVGAPYQVIDACTFENNRWVLQSGASLSFGPNVVSESGNSHVVSMTQAFASLTPPSYSVFDFQTDYHVVPAFLDVDGNGTQAGIYGGTSPWKDGLLPFNPHWIGLDLNGSATQGGLLPGVRVQGSAQTH